MADTTIVGPGGTVGIVGGGQLGRMLALAAAEMGLSAVVLCPDPASPAFAVAGTSMMADYTDEAALAEFAGRADVITYEFENIPSATIEFLSSRVPVYPAAKPLSICQDRLIEKRMLTTHGMAVAPFAPVDSLDDLGQALARIGRPAILKTRRFGYDGKGQAVIRGNVDPAAAWRDIGEAPAILEGFVAFEREISVVAARGRDGSLATYDVVENRHRDGILATSTVPAAISPELADEARTIAADIAAAIGHVGVLAVEMFVLGGRSVLVNEIAPRVHNSGHWTTDACTCSQFEQHLRAICGWPLGDTGRHCDAVMTNLIGADVDNWLGHAAAPATRLHLYGKTETRPGRKMGHVTRLIPMAAPAPQSGQPAADAGKESATSEVQPEE